MTRPTLEEARALAKDYKTVPVSRSVYADIRTPVEALRILKRKSKHCFLMESAEDAEKWGRWTFLGFDPRLGIACTDGVVTLRGEREEEFRTNEPQRMIAEILEEYRGPRLDGFPPLTGGLVGYFAYDYIRYAEPKLRLGARDEENFRDVDLMLFDKIIAFDNLKQRMILINTVKTDDLETNYAKAEETLAEMLELIKNGAPAEREPLRLEGGFEPLFGKAAFCEMVERAKEYIYEGDIFQVVLSNRLAAKASGSLLDIYRVLRSANPSPYLFYFSGGDIEMAGASPETLVKLNGDTLYTFPLAGTRPRGADPEEDRRLETELLSDEKELAEHNMLVDLGRNDLGKISGFGSVKVEKYLSVERFSHVMHLGSTVSGKLLTGKSALDAIKAVLPAGTLSGAPKLRACEIIAQLEDNKRGVYGGAVGYLAFSGDMDTCIAIRLAFLKNGRVFIRSGAGIVADSVPENEYQECVNKARAVVDAAAAAEGGIDDEPKPH